MSQKIQPWTTIHFKTANLPVQLDPETAADAAALEKIGFKMEEGEPGSVQSFFKRGDPPCIVLLQDDGRPEREDVLKHLEKQGVDMKAFLAARAEVRETSDIQT